MTQQSALQVYRGSVNRWECDENDHMNVRFYVSRHLECLAAGLVAAGQAVDSGSVTQMCFEHHLRFHREARLSVPLTGYFSGVSWQGRAYALTELRHSFTEETIGTCLHALHVDLKSVEDCPVYAAPRGIVVDDPYPDLSLGDAADVGFFNIGQGLVQLVECEANGSMSANSFMGRISDGMPHLWTHLRGAAHASSESFEGGAVLEYRMRHHRNVSAGSRLQIRSGIFDVGAKVQHFVHLVFDQDSGEQVLAAQAIGVRMDLTTRKALVLDDAALAHMRSVQLNYN